MNIKKRFNGLKKLIDKELGMLLPSVRKTPETLHKAMRYGVLSGGKRLRPILVIEAAKACGGGTKDAGLAGCAVELIHAYSLIHDDLPSMDDDDYRRGRPACHKVFGEATAILAGDALLTLAFNIISKVSRPGVGAIMAGELSDAVGTKGMVGGQALDLGLKGRNSKKDKKTIYNVSRLKTARLFEVSAKLGAIASGSDGNKVRAMAGYGESFGLAFQIIDDILDNEGYAKCYGVEKAKRDARIQIKKAKKYLASFGKKAGMLNAIADHIFNRIGDQ